MSEYSAEVTNLKNATHEIVSTLIDQYQQQFNEATSKLFQVEESLQTLQDVARQTAVTRHRDLFERLIGVLDLVEKDQFDAEDFKYELQTILQMNELEEINVNIGDDVDDRLHQVINESATADPEDDNTVAEITTTGWQFKERGEPFVRAKVIVWRHESETQ